LGLEGRLSRCGIYVYTPFMYPIVSVIMPVRDVEKYVEESVLSILTQTLVDIELIVIDDHSDDGTYIKLSSMSDLRLKVISNPGSGIVDALNAGLDLAKGEFIARMDGDDISVSERLETQVKCLRENPGTGICSAQVRCFPRKDVSGWYQWYEAMTNGLLTHDEIVNNALIDTPLPHPTWMVRREVFDRVGPYEQGPFPEDYAWLMRAFRQGVRAARVPRVLLRWRERASRASRMDGRYSLMGHLRVKAEHIALTASGRRLVVLGGGKTAKNLITALKKEGVTPTRVVDIRRGRAGGFVKGVPVIDLADYRWQPGELVLVAIHSRTGSWQATKGFLKLGLREGRDIVVTA